MALAKQLQFLDMFCSTLLQSQVFMHLMLLLKVLPLQSCNYSLHLKESCLSHEENARAEQVGLTMDPMAMTRCYGPFVSLLERQSSMTFTCPFPGSTGIAIPEVCPTCGEVLCGNRCVSSPWGGLPV